MERFRYRAVIKIADGLITPEEFIKAEVDFYAHNDEEAGNIGFNYADQLFATLDSVERIRTDDELNEETTDSDSGGATYRLYDGRRVYPPAIDMSDNPARDIYPPHYARRQTNGGKEKT